MNAETITLMIIGIIVLPPILGMFKWLGANMIRLQVLSIIWLLCMATTVQPEPWDLDNEYAVLLGGIATCLFGYTQTGGE